MDGHNGNFHELLDRIAINPKIMTGKPVIRGTRIPVRLVLKMLAQGMSEDEIIDEYPGLSKVDLKAALAYASLVLENEEVFPLLEQEA